MSANVKTVTKFGLIGGLVSAAIMAGFEYLEGKPISTTKFFAHLVYFGLVMTVTYWFLMKKEVKRRKGEI